MARELAQKFGEEFKKTFIVEDKAGGNGDIATDYVARAPPDGQTLLVTTNATVVINPQMFKDVVQFDPVKDFAPVSLLARQPFVLVVNNDLPVKTVGELVDYARAHPGKLNFGSSGAGGGAHLSGEMMKTLLNLKMTHVPYKGVAPALQDVIAGHIDFMFASTDNGKAACRRQAIARACRHQQNPQSRPCRTCRRWPSFPDWRISRPISGMAFWRRRRRIPRSSTSLSGHTSRIQDPALKARFDATGTVLVGTSPDEFAGIIKTDIDKWALVIKSAGMVSQK